MKPPQRTEAERIAGTLTKASRRAMLKINGVWTREGKPGPARTDAYSLGWGRDGHHKLVDRRSFEIPGSLIPGWEYRLTPLGLAVRALLSQDQTDER